MGRAHALAVADAGAVVVVNDVDGQRAREVTAVIEATGGRAITSTHPVDDPRQAQALINETVDRFGRVDALVNNAGLYLEQEPWETEPEQVARLVAVNVVGVLACGTAAIRQMRRQESGVIVNVTSGSHMGLRGMAVYGATKGAVASLTYCWALDLAPAGIRVVGLSPQAATRMSAGADGLADPAAVSPAVVYLLSDDAAHLSGHILRFDGRELTLISPPRPADLRLVRHRWTATSIAEAVRANRTTWVSGVGLTDSDLTSTVSSRREAGA